MKLKLSGRKLPGRITYISRNVSSGLLETILIYVVRCCNHGVLYQSIRVGEVQRIVSDIGIEIAPPVISDRIRLHESPERRRVVSGTVVIETIGLRIDPLSGIAERTRTAAFAIGQITDLAQRA